MNDQIDQPIIAEKAYWLWHGTPMKNVCSILERVKTIIRQSVLIDQGLTDPRKDHRSGCSGIYFADNVMDSYDCDEQCNTSYWYMNRNGHNNQNIGAMFLARVQCDSIKDGGENFANVIPENDKQLIKGSGVFQPNSKKVRMED